MTTEAAIATPQLARRDSRRAWITILAGLVVFLASVGAALVVGIWLFRHATVERSATARLIGGSEAFWRPADTEDWIVFTNQVNLREGGELSTALGTVVWITTFDGSTLEVTEGSHLRFVRLRESRLSEESQLVQLELLEGAVYGAFAPVVDNEYGELIVQTGSARVVVREARRRASDLAPSFVIESRADSESISASTLRVASFRGRLDVTVDGEEYNLYGPDQVFFQEGSDAVRSEAIGSQLVVDGAFAEGLMAWDLTYSAEAREPDSQAGVVEPQATDEIATGTALRIFRLESDVWARTGVVQDLNRTVRLPSQLTLSFDLRIDSQGPALDERSTVPLAVELTYQDILGQDRRWTTAFLITRAEGSVEADAVTEVAPGIWTPVIVDLGNLEPVPKTLESVVVYASGGGYDSYVANLSLTMSEGLTN